MQIAELHTLKEQSKTNTYHASGDIKRADCVIGFSFGYREGPGGIQPGKSNEQLAAFIESNLEHLPLILQLEIVDALNTLMPSLIIREHRQKGNYLHSREIAEQAWDYMRLHGLKSAVIVTHSAMEARNIAICRKVGMETIAPSGLEQVEYDELSAQPWTRDKGAWWERENSIIDICQERGWI